MLIIKQPSFIHYILIFFIVETPTQKMVIPIEVINHHSSLVIIHLHSCMLMLQIQIPTKELLFGGFNPSEKNSQLEYIYIYSQCIWNNKIHVPNQQSVYIYTYI